MASDTDAQDSSAPEAIIDNAFPALVSNTDVKPRIWPAVVIGVLQLVLYFGPAYVTTNPFAQIIAGFWGPSLGALALILWWLFASRLPWLEKLVGLLAFAALMVATIALVHQSMRLGVGFYVLPSVTSGLVLMLLFTQRMRWSSARWLTFGVMLAIAGVWTQVRLDGLDGSFKSELSWLWSPTAEDQFLAERAQHLAKASKSGKSSVETPQKPAPSDPAQVGQGDWPGFRGPARDGRLLGVSFSTDWERNPPSELWRRRVGPGWSSFSVVGDYLFTQEQRGEEEVVTRYHAYSGQELWVNSIDARFAETVGGPGPRATPTYHDGMLFVFGATGVLQCLDPSTGQMVWKRSVPDDTGAATPQWGFASSPLVVGELVIVVAAAKDAKSVAAYDRSSGELKWSSGDGTHSYSSAHLARIADVDQILVSTDFGLQSFNPIDGKQLWQHEWASQGVARIVQPLVLGDDVFVGTGFGTGTRRVNAQSQDGQWLVSERWTTNRFNPYFNDLVHHEGYLYGFDGGFFICVDATSGERKWKRGRYGDGQVLLVVDMPVLLVLGERGDVVLVEPTPERHHELARFKALKGKTWNHPVIAHGRLFVRNGAQAVCYELSPPAQR